MTHSKGMAGVRSILLLGGLMLVGCAHETALKDPLWGQGPPPPIQCTEDSLQALNGRLIALETAYPVLSRDLTLTQRIGAVAIAVEGIGLILTNTYAIPTAMKKTADGIAAGMR